MLKAERAWRAELAKVAIRRHSFATGGQRCRRRIEVHLPIHRAQPWPCHRPLADVHSLPDLSRSKAAEGQQPSTVAWVWIEVWRRSRHHYTRRRSRTTLSSRQHHADLAAFAGARAESGRERLAISALELALKPCLRRLRGHHRRRVRGLSARDAAATAIAAVVSARRCRRRCR
jgi:hypothetical protein